MSETKHTRMPTMEPPGVYCSPLTGSFYFVRRFNKDGSASQKVDVTPHVRGFIREAVEPLKEVNAALLAALEGLMEWEDEIAANLGLHTNPAPLMAKAHAALAKARGEVGDE